VTMVVAFSIGVVFKSVNVRMDSNTIRQNGYVLDRKLPNQSLNRLQLAILIVKMAAVSSTGPGFRNVNATIIFNTTKVPKSVCPKMTRMK